MYIFIGMLSLLTSILLSQRREEDEAARAACVHVSVSIWADLCGQLCTYTHGVYTWSVCRFLLEMLLVGPGGMELL